MTLVDKSVEPAARKPVIATGSIALANYLELGIKLVEGWLSPTTASIIAHLLIEQTHAGLHHDVCEIGVHHGKLFLVLANATVPDERAVAVDVFDDQEKNIDRSGAGNRIIFERHLADYAPAANVEIIQESSLDLHGHGFSSRRFRFVSVDGGHTASTVENDLRLAEHALVKNGVVALDDILSSHWTGVLTGLSNYVAAGGTLIPFALIPNKLLLTTDETSAHESKSFLQRVFPLAMVKTNLEFLTGMVDVYEDHQYYNREDHANLRLSIHDLERQRNVLLAQIDGMHEEIAGLRQSRDDLAQRSAAAETHLATLRASSSWRMTGPLRRIVRFAREGGERS